MKVTVPILFLVSWEIGSLGHAQALTQKFYILSNLDRGFLQEFIVPKMMDSLEQILRNTYKCQNVQIHASVAGRAGDSDVYFNLRANCPPSVRNVIVGVRGFRTAPQGQDSNPAREAQSSQSGQLAQSSQLKKNSIGINIVITQGSEVKRHHPISLW